jgi:hypothetical protein
MLVPFLNFWSLDKHLIEKIYKKQPLLNSNNIETKKENLLFQDAINAIKSRSKLEPGYKTQW